ncbi:MAG TPA: hypothetical protein DHV28_09975 [Ignavibacteriales bacterium]|nr:hypothetical protein [Ignavibacteriales bacterium]
MDKFILILLLLVMSVNLFAQENLKEGKVGYISAQLVYVNFDNTEGMAEKDTLFIKIKNELKPALTVKYLSSSSAACEKIINDEFNSGITIYAVIKITLQTIAQNDTLNFKISGIPVQTPEEVKPIEDIDSKKVSAQFSGRYSLQSYSNLSNVNKTGDYQRWRHSLRLGALNIGGSDLSFSMYAMFAYKADEWNSITSNFGKAAKVYDLNLNYRFSQSAQIWVGRYLNRKISNISIVDGVQFENSFSFLTFGLVAGSRPNFSDFGFNTKLFEYGAYLNRRDTVANGLMENTLSLFEQTNDFKTDRRFAYFQHSNNILTNTYLFTSAEIDLYKRDSYNIGKTDLNLTSIFVSTRYTPVREFSFSLSYDARKNVYYYETFKSVSDSVLENELRQGFRARAVVRPLNNVIIGLQYGYRSSKTDVKPSRNYGGNISYTMIPLIESSLGFNYNRLLSNYVDGSVYSVNLQKSLTSLLSDISIGFRKTDYTFPTNSPKFDEKAILLDFSTSAFYPFSFSFSYEGVFESIRTYGRILFDISTRF